MYDQINYKKRNSVPTNTKQSVLYWKAIDVNRAQGLEYQIQKNTFVTYDGYLLTGEQS